MTEVTLESGKKVKLTHDLTTLEREECEDAVTVTIVGGGQRMQGLAKSRNLWCMKAMETDYKGLDKYTPKDLVQIAIAARMAAGEFGDPLKEGD